MSENRQGERPIELGRQISVGIVGARGYVGAELIRLVLNHPHLKLEFASSRQLAGDALSDHVEGARPDMKFVDYDADSIAEHAADLYFLALPNEVSPSYVGELDRQFGNQTVIIDLSADHRFDDNWAYGLPELNTDSIRESNRIANPGCYATAMQLAVRPIINDVEGPICFFGVSGYSGAGTTPSPRNDPEQLRDNIMPYSLTNHIHEREVARQLGHPIRFTPHVAPFFRGISMTAVLSLRSAMPVDLLAQRYMECYMDRSLVRVTGETIPLVRENVGKCHASVGGFSVHSDDPRQVTIVSTLDNLLKGAASQAIQNANLIFGFEESEGLPA